jgi:hypothetical protein
VSDDYYWYAEGLAGDRWYLPWESEFTWMDQRHPALGAFLGPGAFLPLTPGLPPRPPESDLLDLVARRYAPETRTWWAPYENLLVDDWEVTRVLVAATVPLQYASLFGDGTGPFPMDALRHIGWARLTDRPIDRSFGPGRFELAVRPPGSRIEVTWQDTLADLLGAEQVERFRAISGYPGTRHRIVVVYA